MRAGWWATLKATRQPGRAAVHSAVVAKTGTATGPGAGAVAGWRAPLRRGWGGGRRPAAPWSQGPKQVQGGEGGRGERPLRNRCARRRRVSLAPLTRVMEAVGVGGTGARREDAGWQTAGTREREGQATEHARTRRHAGMARLRLATYTGRRPTAIECAWGPSAWGAPEGALTHKNWSPRKHHSAGRRSLPRSAPTATHCPRDSIWNEAVGRGGGASHDSPSTPTR